MKRRVVVVLLGLIASASSAQQYNIRQYRVERGLPSDIIKSCTQDSLGYFWIATDEGLTRYDGVRFTAYREAMHSNYTKGFLTTQTGRLLAYGDLDLVEIKNAGDTVLFKTTCPVARIASDSAISYPKLVFEDSHRDLWVSESQAVVKLHKGVMKRYPFDLANRSPQFVRSFAFFEDQTKNLFVSSFQGNVFRYNRQLDTFERTSEKLPPGIEHLSVAQDRLIIGSAEGLWQAVLPPAGGFKKPVLKMKVPFVSFVAPIPGGKHFVATRGSRHFIGNLASNNFDAIPSAMSNINHVYVSNENDIWISSNEGLIMMRENLFQIAVENTEFIESITEDPGSGTIYFATNRTLYAFDTASRQSRVVLDIPGGYFQSMVFTKAGIWASNAFRVFLFAGGKIIKQFDFSQYGRFVTNITEDSAGNIWLAIPGLAQAYMIDTSLRLHRFRVPLKNEGVINKMHEGADGMYIASAGKNSYLFFKPTGDSVFRNISLPIPIQLHSSFNVTDLLPAGNGIWLASSEGLLKFDRHHVERVDLGDHFTGMPVKSVHIHPGNKLLTANAYGLILYNPATGTHDLFNESSGLLSNTITNRGLFVSHDQNVWIGTAKGLCYSTQPLSRLHKTPTPQFTRIRANGKNISLRGDSEIEYGSFLSIQASSITFPENEVNLQYRFLPGQAWKNTTEPELHFTAKKAGTHILEIRAKKNGPYSWSQSAQLSFTVSRPFWQQTWFYLLALIGVVMLVAVTTLGVNARNEKNNKELQALIDQRTVALRQSNEELINLNIEKNNLIGIVAHDLKSPLAQIKGLLSLIRLAGPIHPEPASYMRMIETSVARLNDMVMKILDVDAIESRQPNLKMEEVCLSDLCNHVADRYSTEAVRKNIAIARQIDPAVFVTVDRNYTEQILENLLSNAIKFSPFERNIYVSLRTRGNKAVCEIKDEGPGLSDDDKKKLFGKYQKLSAQPTGNEASTGLGLSIVKKFVSAMNGEIWCESEKGKGARFFVAFTCT